ncbi:MAG: hypothetical protein QOF14_5397 [Hyphomicrobiales bacterium]|jgi:hypothetical protein|nr:hypothetical protein [Hyphomicrobiales bacterium]
MAEQWLKIAVEYDKLAEAFERSTYTPPQVQRQPMQQQQSKSEPEDKA